MHVRKLYNQECISGHLSGHGKGYFPSSTQGTDAMNDVAEFSSLMTKWMNSHSVDSASVYHPSKSLLVAKTRRDRRNSNAMASNWICPATSPIVFATYHSYYPQKAWENSSTRQMKQPITTWCNMLLATCLLSSFFLRVGECLVLTMIVLSWFMHDDVYKDGCGKLT